MSWFIFCSIRFRELPLTIKFESSANNIVVKFRNMGPRSLMYSYNSRGPRIDPWGTPQVMVVLEEDSPPNVQYCFLLSK